MSANPAPSQQPPSTLPFTNAEARTFNKHHQQVQHIINRMLQLLEVPNKAARAINGIHGMLNGIDKSKFPVFKAHQYTALQMDFRGQASNADQFMCRALAALDAAEIKCGHSFFKITRADGVAQMITSYDADYLSDAAEWALVQVRNSPEYFKNPAKAVTDEILWDAINKFLPVRTPPEPKDGGDGGPSITDGDVIKAQWTRIINNVEENLKRELKSGADPVLAVKAFTAKVTKIAERLKDNFAREHLRAFSSLGDEDDVDVDSDGNGKYMSDDFLPPQAPNAEPDGLDAPPQTDGVDISDSLSAIDDPSPPPPQTDGVNNKKAQQKGTPDPNLPPQTDGVGPTSMESWALYWAANDVPVFPLYSVTPEGVCRCRDGAQCKSPGKHPKTLRGLKEATTDKAKIQKWCRADPQANIGGATGGTVRLLAVDCDPRHGGDASLHDLVEVHGAEWLDTLQVKTGSGGHHFLFIYPEDVELRNTTNKLAPGIDTRAEGGYIVLPPSQHVSLKRYELANMVETQQAPTWLIEELTRTPGQQPAQVIDFQEKRPRRASGDSVIAEGERNEKLFKVGCALWGQGEAQSMADLHMQLLEVNSRRCSPPLADAEIAIITGSIAGRYPRGVPIQEHSSA